MNKLMICFGVAVLATVLFAATDNKTPPSEAELAARKEMFLKKTGGIIEMPGTGKLSVVNAQTKFDQAAIDSGVAEFKRALHVNIETKTGSWKFGDGVPEGGATVVYVVDDKTMPMSLVTLEDCWGIVNVDKISDAKRFSKEFVRVMIATIGAGTSQYKVSPMQPVQKETDLDSVLDSALTVDAVMGMKIRLEKLGVTQSKVTAYRKACMDGWAPAPTNDIQKAVWDEVHAIPKNPMKIEFDAKKGK